MKPLSELVKRWRIEAEEFPTLAPRTSGQLKECADELQAWLREADDFVGRYGSMGFSICSIRHKILGTTRQEGEK